VSPSRRAVIIGAGLAGSLMASFLGRDGWSVDLYERRSDPRREGFTGGRCINLALSVRGLQALDAVGLSDSVLERVVAMRGRCVHPHQQAPDYLPYSADPAHAIYSIRRAELNCHLLDAAGAYPEVRLHFGHGGRDIQLNTGNVTFDLEAAGESESGPADLLIGADGALSFVRSVMQSTLRDFSCSVRSFSHGYKELTIPADSEGRHCMRADALHVWPRETAMLVALPNLDGTFNCTLFWAKEGPIGFDKVRTPEAVLNLFNEQFGDVAPLMSDLADDYMARPVSPLHMVDCAPWHCSGRTVLIGDAAHAILPFYGQGMNAAFEDCLLLSDQLRKQNRQEQALSNFFTARKPDTDAIAALSLRNFEELCSDVSSPTFRQAKRGTTLPSEGRGPTLYEMISFSNIPYAQAVKLAGGLPGSPPEH